MIVDGYIVATLCPLYVPVQVGHRSISPRSKPSDQESEGAETKDCDDGDSCSTNKRKRGDGDDGVGGSAQDATLPNAPPPFRGILAALREGHSCASLPTLPDNLSYYRHLLERMRGAIGLSADINLIDGQDEAVLRLINLLRLDMAQFANHLHRTSPAEWRAVEEVVAGFGREREGSLQDWQRQMRTPVQELEGKARWADELVFAITPHYSSAWGPA